MEIGLNRLRQRKQSKLVGCVVGSTHVYILEAALSARHEESDAHMPVAASLPKGLDFQLLLPGNQSIHVWTGYLSASSIKLKTASAEILNSAVLVLQNLKAQKVAVSKVYSTSGNNRVNVSKIFFF